MEEDAKNKNTQNLITLMPFIYVFAVFSFSFRLV